MSSESLRPPKSKKNPRSGACFHICSFSQRNLYLIPLLKGADIEAFSPLMQDVSSGPRFVSIKIDSANLERVLSSRDGTFIVTRIRGALGFGPI